MLNECIIFGFSSDSNVIEVLNYCVLYAKYYNYIQSLELFAYKSQLKYGMEIEYKICKSETNEKKCAKYNFVYENL